MLIFVYENADVAALLVMTRPNTQVVVFHEQAEGGKSEGRGGLVGRVLSDRESNGEEETY
jgi:hypothetical protein